MSAVAAIAVGGLVGPRVLLHPGSAIVGRNPASDFQIMTWSLNWWPWAVGHGVNPLHTRLLWAPTGFSSLWMTTIPVPALFALPLTLTAGPLVAYNMLMLLAVVLAAAAAYLLCHELTGRVVPSVLGGLVFGLSPYMLGHTLSQHLDLTFVFPLPLLALLGVRYYRGTISSRRLVAGSTALQLTLLGSSFELFADLVTIEVVVATILVACSRSRRSVLLRLVALEGFAYLAMLPVLGPIAFLGLAKTHGAVQNAPASYAVDALNLVVPTATLLSGTLHSARSVSAHFVGNIGERDGYIGVPLLIVALLALRAEWRRGAWVAGLFVLIALLFSIGPTLVVGGHPLFAVPFALARLPLLGDTLPARMSIFAALGLACLSALWLSRPGWRNARLVVGAAVALSLLPNVWPGNSLPGAWATPHVPAGFVDDNRWRRLIKPGTTVLVLPTRDRTPAQYWQVESGMTFALAIPETPFVPPTVAADPTVARLVNNVLPQRDDRTLYSAQLRAYLLGNRVRTVIVAAGAHSPWRALVRDATATRPVALDGLWLFRVPASLRPLASHGQSVAASARPDRASLRDSPHHRRRQIVRAWLQFDGKRAHLRVRLTTTTSDSVATLSSPAGDAAAPAVAIDGLGRAAVVFTEWYDHRLLLRVATHTPAGWRATTLDRKQSPIWSRRVAITSSGTVLATWIDVQGPSRTLNAAALPPQGSWQKTRVLDKGNGLGAIALRPGHGGVAVAAWNDSLASESRVLATIYTGRIWAPVVILASGLGWLDKVTVQQHAAYVSWRAWRHGTTFFFRAHRHGLTWTNETQHPPSQPTNQIISTQHLRS